MLPVDTRTGTRHIAPFTHGTGRGLGGAAMRHWTRALVTACAVAGAAGFAGAQLRMSPQSAAGGAMPGGQAVGTPYSLNAAGTAVPKAAPPAGSPIGSPLSRPYDPNRPLDAFKGTNIDPKLIVAPIPTMGNSQSPNLLDRLNAKLATMMPFQRPTSPPQQANYTPGISRRNRARAAERNWRRD